MKNSNSVLSFSKSKKIIGSGNTEHPSQKCNFNKTLDIGNNMQNEIIHGLQTERYLGNSSKGTNSGCETKKRNHKRKVYDKANGKTKFESKNRSRKRLPKTSSQSYLNVGRSLKHQKHHNTQSVGFLKSMSQAISEINESSEFTELSALK